MNSNDCAYVRGKGESSRLISAWAKLFEKLSLIDMDGRCTCQNIVKGFSIWFEVLIHIELLPKFTWKLGCTCIWPSFTLNAFLNALIALTYWKMIIFKHLYWTASAITHHRTATSQALSWYIKAFHQLNKLKINDVIPIFKYECASPQFSTNGRRKLRLINVRMKTMNFKFVDDYSGIQTSQGQTPTFTIEFMIKVLKFIYTVYVYLLNLELCQSCSVTWMFVRYTWKPNSHPLCTSRKQVKNIDILINSRHPHQQKFPGDSLVHVVTIIAVTTVLCWRRKGAKF